MGLRSLLGWSKKKENADQDDADADHGNLTVRYLPLSLRLRRQSMRGRSFTSASLLGASYVPQSMSGSTSLNTGLSGGGRGSDLAKDVLKNEEKERKSKDKGREGREGKEREVGEPLARTTTFARLASVVTRKDRTGGAYDRVPPSLGNNFYNLKDWNNSITTSQYAWWTFVPLNLFYQAVLPSNAYFILMAVFQLIPAVSDTNGQPTYLMPLAFVFAVTMLKDFFEEAKRHRSDYNENSKATHVLLDTPQTLPSSSHAQASGVNGDNVTAEDGVSSSVPKPKSSSLFNCRSRRDTSSQKSNLKKLGSTATPTSSFDKAGKRETRGSLRGAEDSDNEGEGEGDRAKEEGTWKAQTFDGRFWQTKPRSDLQPGDIVRVDTDEDFPADLVMLCTSDEDGVAYVNTVQLDGETNTKSKTAIPSLQQLFSHDIASLARSKLEIAYGPPNAKLYSFTGVLRLFDRSHSFAKSNNALKSTLSKQRSLFGQQSLTVPAPPVTSVSTIGAPHDGLLPGSAGNLPRERCPSRAVSEGFRSGSLVSVASVDPSNLNFETPVNVNQFLWRGSTLVNTNWVVGLVVYTGHNTRIFKNTRSRQIKYSGLIKSYNSNTIVSLLLLLLLCFLASVLYTIDVKVTQAKSWYLMPEKELEFRGTTGGQFIAFFTCFGRHILLLSYFVPITFMIQIEIARWFHGFYINADFESQSQAAPQVSTLSVLEDLGGVTHVFSDKTGTLTQNVMQLRNFSLNGLEMVEEDEADREAAKGKTPSGKTPNATRAPSHDAKYYDRNRELNSHHNPDREQINETGTRARHARRKASRSHSMTTANTSRSARTIPVVDDDPGDSLTRLKPHSHTHEQLDLGSHPDPHSNLDESHPHRSRTHSRARSRTRHPSHSRKHTRSRSRSPRPKKSRSSDGGSDEDGRHGESEEGVSQPESGAIEYAEEEYLRFQKRVTKGVADGPSSFDSQASLSASTHASSRGSPGTYPPDSELRSQGHEHNRSDNGVDDDSDDDDEERRKPAFTDSELRMGGPNAYVLFNAAKVRKKILYSRDPKTMETARYFLLILSLCHSVLPKGNTRTDRLAEGETLYLRSLADRPKAPQTLKIPSMRGAREAREARDGREGRGGSGVPDGAENKAGQLSLPAPSEGSRSILYDSPAFTDSDRSADESSLDDDTRTLRTIPNSTLQASPASPFTPAVAPASSDQRASSGNGPAAELSRHPAHSKTPDSAFLRNDPAHTRPSFNLTTLDSDTHTFPVHQVKSRSPLTQTQTQTQSQSRAQPQPPMVRDAHQETRAEPRGRQLPPSTYVTPQMKGQAFLGQGEARRHRTDKSVESPTHAETGEEAQMANQFLHETRGPRRNTSSPKLTDPSILPISPTSPISPLSPTSPVSPVPLSPELRPLKIRNVSVPRGRQASPARDVEAADGHGDYRFEREYPHSRAPESTRSGRGNESPPSASEKGDSGGGGGNGRGDDEDRSRQVGREPETARSACVKAAAVRWNGNFVAEFDASSPDELALVAGAKHLGVEFVRRPDLNSVEVALLNPNTQRIFLGPEGFLWSQDFLRRAESERSKETKAKADERQRAEEKEKEEEREKDEKDEDREKNRAKKERKKEKDLRNEKEMKRLQKNGILLPTLTFQVLEVLDFDNYRKRMSVIIVDVDGKTKILTKGADSSILSVAAPGQEALVKAYSDNLADFAREGLRTLALGYRVLSQSELDNFLGELNQMRMLGIDDTEKLAAVYSKIEKNLTVVACTAIDDRLQDDVPETIEALKDAGIRLWVLTGDKVETAISIGHSCNLLTDATYNAIVDGDTFEKVQNQMYYYMAFVVGGQLAREAFDQILAQYDPAEVSPNPTSHQQPPHNHSSDHPHQAHQAHQAHHRHNHAVEEGGDGGVEKGSELHSVHVATVPNSRIKKHNSSPRQLEEARPDGSPGAGGEGKDRRVLDEGEGDDYLVEDVGGGKRCMGVRRCSVRCCRGQVRGSEKDKKKIGNTRHTAVMTIEEFVSILTFNAKHKKVVIPVDGHTAPKRLNPEEIERLIQLYLSNFKAKDDDKNKGPLTKFGEIVGLQGPRVDKPAIAAAGAGGSGGGAGTIVPPPAGAAGAVAAGAAGGPVTTSPSLAPSLAIPNNSSAEVGGGANSGSTEGIVDIPTRDEGGDVEQYKAVAITVTGDALTHALATEESRKYFFGLAHLCSTVIACRVTPKQKAEVVKWCERYSPGSSFCSLGIGDGANDVGMILTANIGVGIVGKEGSQAARSADISIGEFKILRNLLFAHGHTIVRRHATMMYQTVFKNFVFALAAYIAGFYNGFSAASIFDPILKQFYNLLFTPWPIMSVATFDRHLPYDILLRTPALYPTAMRSDGNYYYGIRKYFAWLGYAFVCAAWLVCIPAGAVAFTTTLESGGRDVLNFDGMGQVIFLLVIIVSVSAAVPFTHTIFWFTPLSYVLSVGSLYICWAILSTTDRAPLEGSVQLTNANIVYHITALGASLLPCMLLFIWWKYRVIFHPTPPVVIRERIKKGVFDVVVAPGKRDGLAVVVPRAYQKEVWKGFAYAESDTRFALRRRSLTFSFASMEESAFGNVADPSSKLALEGISEEEEPVSPLAGSPSPTKGNASTKGAAGGDQSPSQSKGFLPGMRSL